MFSHQRRQSHQSHYLPWDFPAPLACSVLFAFPKRALDPITLGRDKGSMAVNTVFDRLVNEDFLLLLLCSINIVVVCSELSAISSPVPVIPCFDLCTHNFC